MRSEKNTIIFTLSFENSTSLIQTRENQFRSLMCLISEYLDLPGFGICYGGGCCKTCGVIIGEANRSGKKFVLACEVRIDDELAGKSVTIL